MSYWVYLEDEEGLPHLLDSAHQEGGTYAVGGTHECMMNVTYNYGHSFARFLDPNEGLRWLNDKTVSETIERIEEACKFMPDEPSDNYWDSTIGNAGHVMHILLSWARQFPNGIWRIH